jgi:F-type H+-transporting ATPase subunit a
VSNGIAFITGFSNLTLAQSSNEEIGFAIQSFYKYKLFGHEVHLTSTHIAIFIVVATLLIFAAFANRAIRKADPNEVPGKFLNFVELLVETVDKLTISNMGSKHGHKFANYIGTLLAFVLLSNLAGLFGLRPPTADYGVTLALGLITFVLIHWNGFKYQKISHVTALFHPIFLSPINIIGEIATPLSMSLRLFGNVMSGTVMMGLLYGLLPKVLTLVWPSALHVYFDVFSGAIQTYVFGMLTMVFISGTFVEEEA